MVGDAGGWKKGDRGYRVVPEVVKYMRGARGWSQRRLAEELGMHPGLVNCIERGHLTSPHYETLEKLAATFGVAVDDLVDPTTPPN